MRKLRKNLIKDRSDHTTVNVVTTNCAGPSAEDYLFDVIWCNFKKLKIIDIETR